MIISNTTPLSNFLHLDRLDILTHLFHEIHIPQSVNNEIEDFFSSHATWKRLLDEKFFIIHQIPPYTKTLNRFSLLHPGEADALWLYMDLQASLFLVDDKDVRTFAALNNVKISGTISILIEAKGRGLVKHIKPFLDILRTQHYFWINNDLYHKVLTLSHEE